MRRMVFVSVGLSLLAGCGGGYVLTVPDQVAPAGGEAVTVIRLQRQEVFTLALAVRGAAMRFRAKDGPLRGAYTDELGYAGASVPVSDAPGRYAITVSHMDREGDEVSATAPLYVFAADATMLAVDLDSLPSRGQKDAPLARRVLAGLPAGGGVLYFTRRASAEHRCCHEFLAAAGYPDGPVLLWQRQRWHIVRDGPYNLPRIVVESRLVSQLAELRRLFPKLQTGLCGSALSAKAYLAAGMRCVLIGPSKVALARYPAARLVRYPSWSQAAEKGIPLAENLAPK